MWESASSLADYFASNDKRTLVIKDYSSAVLYPHHKSRSFCNLDCFVFSGNSAVDYGSISYMQTIDSNAMSWDYSNTLIGRLGIEVDNKVYLHSVFDYKGLKIENHRYSPISRLASGCVDLRASALHLI